MTVTSLPQAQTGSAPEIDEAAEGSHAFDPERVSRWVPTRAGIINVWRYYDETFEFRRGRLLLRGQNGTGKSKALEVLLPFLLDASLRPNRLSTFGTSDRTMHWNLMGEGASGVTRVGYVWVEFGHDGPEPAWLTCGARLQASTHTTTVHPDFFITHRRHGQPSGFALVNEANQPLTRAQLEHELGPDAVYGSATDYRNTLRKKLFPGMSDQRYEALITALLQLRTPKLSQRLDPALLSTLLSRALPPLDQSEISELAEGFERLDRQREEVARLRDIVQGAQAVANQARGYSRRRLRAAAAGLISATSAMDTLTRTARESEEEFRRIEGECQAAEAREHTLGGEISSLRARIEGLEGSDSYRQGQELDRLRRQVAEAEQEAGRKRSTSARLAAAAGAARTRADTEQAAAVSASRRSDRLLDDLRQQGDRVRMSSVMPSAGLEVDPREARSLMVAAIAERSRQIADVRTALQEYDGRVADRRRAEGAVTDAADALDRAQAELTDATSAYAAAVEEQERRLAAWVSGCTELELTRDEVMARAADERGLIALVSAARDRVWNELSTQSTRVRAALDETGRQADVLETELDTLRASTEIPPPAPATRTADRSGRAGAPLWRLTSFTASVEPDVQGSVEAALEASGLLDAWISPDGRVQSDAGHDSFALVLEPPRPDSDHAEHADHDRSLADVLTPDDDGPVPPELLRTLLNQIRLGATVPSNGPAGIGLDGSWRVAHLTGTWSKAAPAYIGAAARQRARLARLAELNNALAVVAAQAQALRGELAGLDQRRRNLEVEVSARPAHAPVTEAERRQLRWESMVDAATGHLSTARTLLSGAEQDVSRALRRLTAVAAERALPADRDALASLDSGLAHLRETMESWVHALGAAQSAEARARIHAETAAAARVEARTAQAEADGAQERAAEHRNRLAAVEESLEAPYLEVLAAITTSRDALKRAENDQAATQLSLRTLSGRSGRLDATRTIDAQKRDDAIQSRDLAGQTLRRLAGLLIEDAAIDAGLSDRESVKGILDLARAMASTWGTVPYEPRNVADALARLTQVVHENRELLAQRVDLELVSEDDAQVLTAAMNGMRMSAAEMVRVLTAERDSSTDDITVAEHDLFDTTLTGDTRRHLATRIRQAGDLVDGMNAHLDRVRTASDVSVRLTWQVDPALPAGTKAARELLLKDPVRLSDVDRSALHTFFRERVEDARAANTAASWEEQLGDVFDYTSWHRFVVKVDRGKGSGWEDLTKRLHGALSGGEKAIALHLPLFAAVAAHYAAVPSSPRLILLDEVFVGVDSANRGQVFALLSALDLDLVLTSDHEWCTYRELDAIAIHQLVTGDDGDDAVTSVRFTWDGHQLLPSGEA